VLSESLKVDSIYCDVGAWIGPTVIFAARKCKRVYCFEPDPVAYENLLRNIRLNELRNVMPFNMALTGFDGTCRLATFGKSLGDSMSSTIDPGEGKPATCVPCMKWETAERVFGLDAVDFVKIDIEGGEFSLIPSLRDYLLRQRPTVYLSTHAPYLPECDRLPAMARVVDVMKIYGHCINEASVHIAVSGLLSKDVLNDFRTFLFKD